jgi:hypothetical protein
MIALALLIIGLWIALSMLGLSPIAGKLGIVQSTISDTPTSFEFHDWKCSNKVHLEPADGFDKIQSDDGAGNYYEQFEACLAGGDVTLTGTFDDDNDPYDVFYPAQHFAPTTSDQLFLSYDGTTGAQVQGWVEEINPSTDVTKTGQFEVKLKIENFTWVS